jgi:hypothetical protein
LLFGLYEIDAETTFSRAKNLLTYDSSLAYFTLGRLPYKIEQHILATFEIANNVDINNIEGLLQIPYIYTSLVENKNTPDNIKKQCFTKMAEVFSIENEQLRNSIFMDCQLMDDYEAERYKLLVETFLTKSQTYFKRINDYFRNFKNSDYFFELFSMLYHFSYKHHGLQFDTKPFERALAHFWNKDKERCEQHLLDLLSHDISYLRIGAAKLIRSKYSGCYEVNLLSLDSEIKQLRAVEALFFICFYNIDTLLPLLLSVRYSSYEKVVVYLQGKLSELIVEAYHDHLYKQIIKLTTDEKFLNPLKNALNDYHKVTEMKASINDLNPMENEHDLMNLYYRLEQEEKQKLMHKINNDDNSFLSLAKTTVIVRGNSWKINDNEVSPLGTFEKSMFLDMRMYKNPDLFDYNYRIFNSNF